MVDPGITAVYPSFSGWKLSPNRMTIRKFEVLVERDTYCEKSYTHPETNSLAPENRPSQKETIVFQPSIFKGYVSFREAISLKHSSEQRSKPFLTFDEILIGS